jgi:uncharacterized protein (DUF433 family)
MYEPLVRRSPDRSPATTLRQVGRAHASVCVALATTAPRAETALLLEGFAEVEGISYNLAMATDELLSRITTDPEIFGGKPVVRGMRISVELVLSLLAQGETVAAILDDYPDLEHDDVRACLEYARAVIAHDRIEGVRVAST